MPITLISILHCFSLISKTAANEKKDLELAVSQIRDEIDKAIDQTQIMSNLIYGDSKLKGYLETKSDLPDVNIKTADSIDELNRYIVSGTYIEDILIYTSNEKLYGSQILRHMSDINKTEAWYDIFKSSGKSLLMLSYYDSYNDRNKFSIIRVLNNVSDCEAILKIDLSYLALSKLLETGSKELQMCVLDSNGSCVIGDDTNVFDKFPKLYGKDDRGYSVIEMNFTSNKNYKIYCKYKSSYIKSVLIENGIFLFIIILVMLFGCIIISVILTPVVDNLKNLAIMSKKMQNAEYDIIPEKNIGNDEVGTLVKGFNCASMRINGLINEVYEEKLKRANLENEKNKARFSMLQSQINPHFLFNMFELLRMYCIKRGDNDTAQMIQNMSVILRSLIDWKTDIIPLSDEMRVVNAFLSLSMLDMENELDIEINIAPSAESCGIPKMMVQVFVENAVRHGLDEAEYRGKIGIDITADGDYISITIKDNGKGLDQELAAAVNGKNLEYINSLNGIGLSTIFSRAKLYYGDDFYINVTSEKYVGTVFNIKLPKTFLKKEN